MVLVLVPSTSTLVSALVSTLLASVVPAGVLVLEPTST